MARDEVDGIQEIETGKHDSELLASETIASFLPYTHFYVTTVDIAELVIMTCIHEPYNVKVYDHNESSLYKLIQVLTDSMKNKQMTINKEMQKSMFKRGGGYRF